MNKIQIFIVLIIIISLFTSCFKEDEMVEPHKPGNVELQTIAMGQYYTMQAYFDLGTNQMVKTNSKDIFDLLFHCGDSTLIIKLNSAKFMKVGSLGDTNFFASTDTIGMEWNYDASSGNTDSLALNNWFIINGNDTIFTQKVFIIDRGLNDVGIPQGIRKMRIVDYENDEFTIEYSNLNNSNFHRIIIKKQPEPNYIQLNLNNGALPTNLEPNKKDWDLLFTQYTDILTTSIGEKYPYLVTGVLLNPNLVMAAIDTTLKFDDIKIDHIPEFEFSARQNKIGYEWKYYDFDAGFYTVLSEVNYILKDVEGYYYKLRFVNFYNNLGEKGYPQFEFQRL